MLLPLTCWLTLIHLSLVIPQPVQNVASSSKEAPTVYYIQKDGRIIRSQEGSANRTDITDKMVNNYPITDLQPQEGSYSPQAAGPSSPHAGEPTSLSAGETASPQFRLIETNALTQHLPNGTAVGELYPKMTEKLGKAYPWNAVISESPSTMKKGSIRPSTSIDQIIEKTNGGPRASHYPTKSGHVLTELDMMMSVPQYMYYYEGRNLVPTTRGHKRVKRKALQFEFTYWPNGLIPYTIDSSFNSKDRKLLLASMKDWMDKTCVQFVPATPEHTDVLDIQNGQGCNSFVGRIGGYQSITLQPACREIHVMKHELGHVLGLIHEHQRPDRDNYITVARHNVGQGRLKNYKKFARDRINTYGVDYDYTSIMHYGKTAFSKDDYSTTMITRDPSFQDIIGTTSMVSFKDAMLVNDMYKCAGHCKRKPACGDGYVDKNCQCVCPDGTKRCSRRSRGHDSSRHRGITNNPRRPAPTVLIRHTVFPFREQEQRQEVVTTRENPRQTVVTTWQEPRQVVFTRRQEPRQAQSNTRQEPIRTVASLRIGGLTRPGIVARREPVTLTTREDPGHRGSIIRGGNNISALRQHLIRSILFNNPNFFRHILEFYDSPARRTNRL